MKHFLSNSRWRVALYCGGCLAIWAIWALIYGMPGANEIRANRLELKEAEATFSELARVANQLPGELAALQGKEESLENTLAGLPCEEEIPAVTRSFTECAISHGLQVVAADLEIGTIFGGFTRVSEQEELSVLPFTLVVQGRYKEVGRFLEDITSRGVYVGCESITISRLSDVRGEVEATISINLYALAGVPSEKACDTKTGDSLARAGRVGGASAPRDARL